MRIVAVIILLASSFLDGLRDAGVTRMSDVSWWNWHVVKWLAWYPALVFLLVFAVGNRRDKYHPAAIAFWIIAACYGLWQAGYHCHGLLRLF